MRGGGWERAELLAAYRPRPSWFDPRLAITGCCWPLAMTANWCTHGANWLNETSLTATARGGVLDCGLLLACTALLRLTPSLCLQVHYSCMLGVGRRELRRCLCICVRVQHGASGVEIVRITLGNYHVEPQSREARLWLVHINSGFENDAIAVAVLFKQ